MSKLSYVIPSMIIANKYNKDHEVVLDDIRRIKDLSDKYVGYFNKSSYIGTDRVKRICYEINENGLEILEAKYGSEIEIEKSYRNNHLKDFDTLISAIKSIMPQLAI
ncbi:MAG: Rha family transcriptional regulator [Peptostreptococcaceae bacterium]